MIRARILKNAVTAHGAFTADKTVTLTKATFEKLKAGGIAVKYVDWLKAEAASEGYAVMRQGRRFMGRAA